MLAPCSLIYTMDGHPAVSAGLPHSSGFVLVRCHPGFAMGFLAFAYASTLHPFSYYAFPLALLCPRMLWFHSGLPGPCLCISPTSRQLVLSPPDKWDNLGCLSPRLYLVLHLPWVQLCQLGLWLHPGSILNRFCHGSSCWLQSGWLCGVSLHQLLTVHPQRLIPFFISIDQHSFITVFSAIIYLYLSI